MNKTEEILKTIETTSEQDVEKQKLWNMTLLGVGAAIIASAIITVIITSVTLAILN